MLVAKETEHLGCGKGNSLTLSARGVSPAPFSPGQLSLAGQFFPSGQFHSGAYLPSTAAQKKQILFPDPAPSLPDPKPTTMPMTLAWRSSAPQLSS